MTVFNYPLEDKLYFNGKKRDVCEWWAHMVLFRYRHNRHFQFVKDI